MTNRRQRWMNGIRAAAGAMLLLFNWLAVPVSLASSEPEFCSMECCVADGHCCCAARKLWVEGQKPGDSPIVSQHQVSSKCSYSCAPSSKRGHSLRVIERPVAQDRVLAEKPSNSHGDSTPIHNSSRFALSSPRAPPPFN